MPRRPAAPRVGSRRTPEAAGGLPLAARLALGVALVGLVAVVLTTVTGVLPSVVRAFGDMLAGIAGSVVPAPTPSPTVIPAPGAPVLDAPHQAYTRSATVTITGSVPPDIAGLSGYKVRLYVTIAAQPPARVVDVAVGATPAFAVPNVPLEPGRNDFTATILGPGAEGKPSPIISYILDTSKPAITITSPKANAVVNGPATIVGKTQAGSSVIARNAASGDTGTATADAKGAFSMKIGTTTGTNAISITATDPAGNAATTVLTIRGGSGKLTVKLTGSASQISIRRLPAVLILTATVIDPNGKAVPGAVATFSVTVPGVPPIVGSETTNASGVATFQAKIPPGATVGSFVASVSVTTATFGNVTGLFPIAMVE